MRPTVTAALALAGVMMAPAQPAAATGPGQGRGAIVHTASGPVRGKIADDHRSFLGIPYAAPPVGELRWQPPHPVRSWSAPRDATRAGKACAQNGTEVGRPSTSEDCLYLNVTTPRTGRRLPVIVYLHGGSFADGAGHLYDPARLATQGQAVVITVNYRLGALGFLAHPALKGDNFGLRDQQAAMRWAARNASAFGGDPGNITLMGESAGALSVTAHLTSPRSAGLFHRAIIQSGQGVASRTPSTPNLPRSRQVAEKEGLDLVARIPGLPKSPTAKDLRKITPEDLLKAADHSGFGPVTGGDILPIDPAQALTSGHFNRVPVLQGITRNEHQLQVWGMEMSVFGGKPLPAEEYPQQIKATFGDNAAKVLAAYPADSFETPGRALAAVLTDAFWARPAAETAIALAAHVPTYSYEFTGTPPWFIGPDRPGYDMGAFHTGDLPYLFDLPQHYQRPDTGQQALADQMIGYWSRFARTGNPNGGGAPQWHPFRGTHPYVQELANQGSGPVEFARNHRYTFWKELDLTLS